MSETRKDWFSERLSDPEFAIDYYTEYLAEDFLIPIEEELELQGLSKKDLAEKLKYSPPNITKKLKKGTNLTLRSMVEIALALKKRVRIVVESIDPGQRAKDVPWNYLEEFGQGDPHGWYVAFLGNESTLTSSKESPFAKCSRFIKTLRAPTETWLSRAPALSSKTERETRVREAIEATEYTLGA